MRPEARERIVAALERHGERTNRQIMGCGVTWREVMAAHTEGLTTYRLHPDAAVRWRLTA